MRAARLGFLTCLYLAQLSFAQVPDPKCLIETPLWGDPTAASTGTLNYQIAADFSAKFTKFRLCKCCPNRQTGIYEDTIGFKGMYVSRNTGLLETLTFGNPDNNGLQVTCIDVDFGQAWVTHVTVHAEPTFIEGLSWTDEFGKYYEAKADGTRVVAQNFKLGGWPIGFRVYEGKGNRPQQPLLVSVVMNTCPCVWSDFKPNPPPQKMEIQAVLGATQIQNLPFMHNSIEDTYGNNCGTYSIVMTPSLSFLTATASGTQKDRFGRGWLDTLTLTAGTANDVGLYTINFVYRQDLSKTSDGYTQPVRGALAEVVQQMQVIVHPCTVESFRAVLVQPNQTYLLGEPGLGAISGAFTFEQIPNCGYSPKISVSGLPEFVTYDAVLNRFNYAATQNKLLLGVHDVIVTATFSQPTDYQKTFYTQKTASSPFQVIVTECQIQSLEIAPPQSVMSYAIPDPSLTAGTYSISQIPDCKYVIQTSITSGATPLVTWNQVAKDFTIARITDMTMRGQSGKIEVVAQYQSSLKSVPFILNWKIVNPCETTILDPSSVANMVYYVADPANIQNIKVPQDSVSKLNGSKDGYSFCGNRLVSISPTVPFLTVDPKTGRISVQTTDLRYVGVHSFDLRVYMEAFPELYITQTFTVRIGCKVNAFQFTPVTPVVYTVHTPQQFFTLSPLVPQPDCGLNVVYSYGLKNPTTGVVTNLPAWMTLNSDMSGFVYTQNPLDQGKYLLVVTGTVTDPGWTFVDSYEVPITIDNDCSKDLVTPLDSIPNQLYYIARGGTRSFAPSWSHSESDCPTHFEIAIVKDGVERALTPLEQSVIAFSTKDGAVSYATDNFALDGQTWTVSVKMKSTYSAQPDTLQYLFDITFRDSCWDALLAAAQFVNTNHTYDLWQLETLDFAAMKDLTHTGTDLGFCGGYTHQLQYVAGPVLDKSFSAGADLSHYTQTENLFKGVVNKTSWLGTHTFRIVSTLGSSAVNCDANGTCRGKQGLFNSVFSNPLTLTIVDPCLNSVVNQDGKLHFDDMAVPLGSTILQMNYSGPTDSVSVKYGNGYDKCGPLTYTLFNDAGIPFSLQVFSSSFVAITDRADEISLTLESFADGSVKVANFTMEIKLSEYPKATPYRQQVVLYYRECVPYDFTAPTEPNHTLMVTDPGFVTKIAFNQFPCTYTQSYSLRVFDRASGSLISPSSLVTAANETVTVKAPTIADVGECEVHQCSTVLGKEVCSIFFVNVIPCQVESLTFNPTSASLTQTIGLAPLTGGAHTLTQVPACGYPVVVTDVSTTYLKHSLQTNDFTMPQITDTSVKGFSAIATVTAFVDCLRAGGCQNSNVQAKPAFTLNYQVVNPCETTLFDPLVVADIVYQVAKQGVTRRLVQPFDSASQQYGKQDGMSFCGERLIEIASVDGVQAFLGFDPSSNTITVMTNDLGDLGLHTFTATVRLVNFPEVKQTTTFTVHILCEVFALKADPVPQQVYTVHTPPVLFKPNDFQQAPACGYNLTNAYKLYDPVIKVLSPLPSWITFDGTNFSVFTDDESLVGEHFVAVVGSVTQTPVYTDKYLISVLVDFGCKKDLVTPLDSIPNQLYYIARGGTRSFAPSWSHSESDCPTHFEIAIVKDGVERALTPLEQSVIAFSTKDGAVSYATDNFALDGQTWTVSVKMKSTYSAQPDTPQYLFDITFRDSCWDALLAAAQFVSTNHTYDLWQLETLDFAAMKDLTHTGTDLGFCGGYTHQLQYVAGPVQTADMSIYSETGPVEKLYSFQGTVTNFDWIGKSTLRIKSTLGRFSDSNIRGNRGLFKSVYSEPITLTINNPCINSVVNADLLLKWNNMSVPQGLEHFQQVIKGPTDSISSLYGNGYDKCGPRVYTFLDSAGLPYSLDVFTTEVIHSNGDADRIQFDLKSFKDGLTLSSNFTMVIGLRFYPKAPTFAAPVTLSYRICAPYRMAPRPLPDQEMLVGDPPVTVDVTFDQYPCNFTQTFQLKVANASDAQDSEGTPPAIAYDGQSIKIETPETRNVGAYTVSVCSAVLTAQKCTTFALVVKDLPPPKKEDPFVKEPPNTGIVVQNQQVAVGSDLAYSPRIPLSIGYRQEVKVDLGQAASFALYDFESGQIRVDGDLLLPSHVGRYEISVTVHYYDNFGFSEEKTVSFSLTVFQVDPKVEKEEVVEDDTAPSRVYYPPEQPQFLQLNLTQKQEYDPERPIPYIRDLKPDGTLIIGWDDKMKPPTNMTLIPPTQVAVEKGLDVEALRFWQRRADYLRRKLVTYDNFEPMVTQPEVVLFVDEKARLIQRMKLLDALELIITPEDPERAVKLEFTWDIVEYDEDVIKLRLVFENPDEVSSDFTFDTLSVTFWGTQFFKNKKDKEVLYGTTLYWPLARQFDSAESQDIVVSLTQTLVSAGVLPFLCLILPALTAGSLLPTWMFINSLQIITHTVLLPTHMPVNAHYFLSSWNDWMRWYDSDFWQFFVNDVHAFKEYDIDTGDYHPMLLMSNYKHLFGHNLIIVTAVMALMGVILLGLAIRDLIVRKVTGRSRPFAPWFANFILRFFYEFFLEFCICAFLQLSVVDSTTFAPTFQLISAVLFTVAIAALVLFVASLLFWRGPQVAGFFKRATICKSFNETRPRDVDFDWQGYCDDRPKPRQQHEWLSKFVLFFNCGAVTFAKAARVPEVKDDADEELAGNSERGFFEPSPLRPSERTNQRYGVFEGGELQSSRILLEPPSAPEPYLRSLTKHVKRIDQVSNSSRIEREAYIRTKVARHTTVSQRYRTLFYGLRANEARASAVVHPLMFLTRRVIYAVVIVCMDEIPVWGVFIVMACCLSMLAYALTEWQWNEKIINYQHLFDEMTIYVLCIFLLLYSGYVARDMRYSLGWWMIGVCLLYVLVNTVVILTYNVRRLWLFLKRFIMLRRRNRLRTEVLRTVKHLNLDLPLTNIVKPDQLKQDFATHELKFYAFDALGGGYGSELLRSQKNNDGSCGDEALALIDDSKLVAASSILLKAKSGEVQAESVAEGDVSRSFASIREETTNRQLTLLPNARKGKAKKKLECEGTLEGETQEGLLIQDSVPVDVEELRKEDQLEKSICAETSEIRLDDVKIQGDGSIDCSCEAEIPNELTVGLEGDSVERSSECDFVAGLQRASGTGSIGESRNAYFETQALVSQQNSFTQNYVRSRRASLTGPIQTAAPNTAPTQQTQVQQQQTLKSTLDSEVSIWQLTPQQRKLIIEEVACFDTVSLSAMNVKDRRQALAGVLTTALKKAAFGKHAETVANEVAYGENGQELVDLVSNRELLLQNIQDAWLKIMQQRGLSGDSDSSPVVRNENDLGVTNLGHSVPQPCQCHCLQDKHVGVDCSLVGRQSQRSPMLVSKNDPNRPAPLKDSNQPDHQVKSELCGCRTLNKGQRAGTHTDSIDSLASKTDQEQLGTSLRNQETVECKQSKQKLIRKRRHKAVNPQNQVTQRIIENEDGPRPTDHSNRSQVAITDVNQDSYFSEQATSPSQQVKRKDSSQFAVQMTVGEGAVDPDEDEEGLQTMVKRRFSTNRRISLGSLADLNDVSPAQRDVDPLTIKRFQVSAKKAQTGSTEPASDKLVDQIVSILKASSIHLRSTGSDSDFGGPLNMCKHGCSLPAYLEHEQARLNTDNHHHISEQTPMVDLHSLSKQNVQNCRNSLCQAEPQTSFNAKASAIQNFGEMPRLTKMNPSNLSMRLRNQLKLGSPESIGRDTGRDLCRIATEDCGEIQRVQTALDNSSPNRLADYSLEFHPQRKKLAQSICSQEENNVGRESALNTQPELKFYYPGRSRSPLRENESKSGRRLKEQSEGPLSGQNYFQILYNQDMVNDARNSNLRKEIRFLTSQPSRDSSFFDCQRNEAGDIYKAYGQSKLQTETKSLSLKKHPPSKLLSTDGQTSNKVLAKSHSLSRLQSISSMSDEGSGLKGTETAGLNCKKAPSLNDLKVSVPKLAKYDSKRSMLPITGRSILEKVPIGPSAHAQMVGRTSNKSYKDTFRILDTIVEKQRSLTRQAEASKIIKHW